MTSVRTGGRLLISVLAVLTCAGYLQVPAVMADAPAAAPDVAATATAPMLVADQQTPAGGPADGTAGGQGAKPAAVPPDRITGARLIQGTWLAADAKLSGWRHITRYDISVVDDRFSAVGDLILTSPSGLTRMSVPTVAGFSGTIAGNALDGEVQIDWRRRFSNGVATTRPMRGTADFERGELVIQYSGPEPTGINGDKAEGWLDADQIMTLRLIGRGERRRFDAD